jgi:hypothetical protein
MKARGSETDAQSVVRAHLRRLCRPWRMMLWQPALVVVLEPVPREDSHPGPISSCAQRKLLVMAHWATEKYPNHSGSTKGFEKFVMLVLKSSSKL